MVLMKIFEYVIDPAVQSGSRILSTKGYVTTPLVNILDNIQRLYGKPIYQELDAALLHINKMTNQMQLVKVMLRRIEYVQLFLLYNPEEDWALTEPNLISYAPIKLMKTGGMYEKGKEKW